MHGAKYRHAARTCDVVMVNSSFTGDDVAETLGIARERIHVAYPGVDPEFAPGEDHVDLGTPYILTVATLEPRKNLATLLQAHRLLGDGAPALAVAGAAGWGDQPSLDAPGVLLLGYTPPADLPSLYRGSSVFVYPSLYEGFGMPVLEAMACGIPCVVSSHPSLDEVCGDAALRADPSDAEAIAASIRLAFDERESLAAKGIRHAHAFTWLANGRAHLAAWEAAR
jgi:alpha-1,3-rhamnosyl/mannosyltransferase